MVSTIEKLEGMKRAGNFGISPGKEIYGELTLVRPKTTLYHRDKEHFGTHAIPER
jgi:hypothetical protein